MGTSAIQITDVSLAFTRANFRTQIFANLNLEISQGEFLSVVGASGTGKTTLLNLIAGFLQPEHGEIRFTNSKSKISFGFQSASLFPWLSVRDNIEFGLNLKAQGNLNRQERQDRITHLVEILGLENLLQQPVSSLSGGQAQRVAIARTLAIEPEILLLDEPFGALDAGTRHALQDWLKNLQQQLGLTVVLVTHDLEEALYLGDRVALLNHEIKQLQIYECRFTDRFGLTETETHKQILKLLKQTKEQTWQI